MKVRSRDSLLILISSAIGVALLIGIDRCVGLILSDEHDLVFRGRSSITYSTPEFQVDARINNLGFRGSDTEIDKQRLYRIVTFGDSFTFGWGVDDWDTWPRVLEVDLQRRHIDSEVLNLGRPGAHFIKYAEIAERAIPLLRPDLVIIAANHGDDLAQVLKEGELPGNGGVETIVWSATKAITQAVFPNMVELRRRISAAPPERKNVTAGWRDQVAGLLTRLKAEERVRFDCMDAEMKEMFLKGGLNPAMLASGLRTPDEMQRTLVLDDPAVQDGIRAIYGHLSRIKTMADESGARVMLVSLPNGFFVSPKMLETYARIGFVVDQSYLSTTLMDESLRIAASSADIRFVEVTQAFREQSSYRDLFFEYDGHYNRDGQRLFASSIAPFVAEALENLDAGE